MTLAELIQQLEACEKEIETLRASGELARMYRFDREAWDALHDRYGELEYQVEVLMNEESYE